MRQPDIRPAAQRLLNPATMTEQSMFPNSSHRLYLRLAFRLRSREGGWPSPQAGWQFCAAAASRRGLDRPGAEP